MSSEAVSYTHLDVYKRQTVFYDPSGHEYIRQGPYLSQAKLEQDVRRYALA